MLLPLIGLIVLAKVPAWDAAPIGGKLVVVDDKFLTVSGYDAATGKKSWTSKVINEAKGRHTLHAIGGEVLAWFGETLSSIEPATGKVHALGQRGYNGVAWQDGGCWIDLAEGIAVQRCQCSFQVFDPKTNKDLGPRYQKTYIEYHESDENGNPSRSAGCWGMSEQLFGKAGNLALISAEDGKQRGKGKMRGDSITAAIDVVKGTEVWRLPQASQFGGHSPDGKTCWFYGFTEAIIAVDCATGSKLWSGTALPSHGRHVVTFVPGAKTTKGSVLDVRTPSKARGIAELYDERTGASRWTTKLPPGSFAWVRGTVPVLATSAHDVSSLVILDPATGRPLATIPKTAGASFELDGRGGFVLQEKNHVIAYDADGKETGRAALEARDLTFGEALLVVTLEKELVVLERQTLRERGRIPGAFTVVHVEGALGANHLAAYTYDGKTIGTVTLLSVR
jgi:outer membrane protein assembly factor BamB